MRKILRLSTAAFTLLAVLLLSATIYAKPGTTGFFVGHTGYEKPVKDATANKPVVNAERVTAPQKQLAALLTPGHNSMTYNYDGSQLVRTLTLPANATNITIKAVGASGGSFGSNMGGLGALVSGSYGTSLANNTLTIVVGQKGTEGGFGSGGGGGSFVYINGATQPLVAAGGGGGAGTYAASDSDPAIEGINANNVYVDQSNPTAYLGLMGTNGNYGRNAGDFNLGGLSGGDPGYHGSGGGNSILYDGSGYTPSDAGGGAGWLTSPTDVSNFPTLTGLWHGSSPNDPSGAIGGQPDPNYGGSAGGYGGGGAFVVAGGGGGGGYSGGGGGNYDNNADVTHGGGGGSFFDLTQGTLTSTSTQYGDPGTDGVVVIEWDEPSGCTAPAIATCNSNITQGTDAGLCSAVVSYGTPAVTGTTPITWTYSFSGATTGSGSGTGSGATFNKGVTTVTLTTTNSCGTANCSFTVTVNDTQAPVTPTLSAINAECSATVSAPTTTDNCSGTITGTTSDPLTYNAQGDYTIHWTFTDGAGNSTTAAQLVHIKDVTPPTITCPGNITTTANTVLHGTSGANVTYAATATDNCSTPTITYSIPSGNFFPVGTTTVTATATDAAGLTSTCSFTVTVNCDVAKPTITAGGPTTICAGGTVNLSASAAAGYLWSTGATTQSISAGAGVYTVAATDGANCSSTPSDPITITANPVPTVNAVSNQEVCHSNTTNPVQAISFSGNVPGTVFSWTNNNPSIGLAASGTGDIASFVGVNTGNTPVTATITVTPSYTNNGVTCTGTPISFTITVDPIPVFNAIADQTVCNGSATTAINFTSGVSPVTYNWYGGATIGLPNGSGSTLPSFTAVNAGNSATNTLMIVVSSYEGTSISCGTSRAFNITVNPTPVATVTTEGGVTSTCPGGTITLHAGVAPGNSYQWQKDGNNISGANGQDYQATTSGSYTVIVTNNGCTSVVSNAVAVSIQDITAPVTPTLSDITAECSATVTAPTTTDNCSGTITGTTSDPLTYNAQGDYTIHWTFTDNANNSTTATQQVHIKDVTPPTVNCPGDITVTASATQNGNGGAFVNYSATGTDNCGTPAISYSIAPGSFFPIGNTPVTVTADDGHGNTSTCTFHVIVTCGTPSTIQVTVVNNCDGTSVLTSNGTGNLLWSNNATTPVITVTTGGTYTVTQTLNGCVQATGSAVADPGFAPVPVINPSATSVCVGGTVTLTATGGTNYLWNYGPNTATISNTYNTAGTYTYTVSNSVGHCTSTSDPVTITVNALPANPTVTAAGPTVFCTGGSVVLSISNVDETVTYQWYKDGNPISNANGAAYTATVAGSYTVVATNGNGCSATSLPVGVTVNTYPTAPVITTADGTSVCFPNGVPLAATGASNYLWSTGGSGATSTTNNNPGDYTVTVSTSANGCVSTSQPITVHVNPQPKLFNVSGGGGYCAGGSGTTISLSNSETGINYKLLLGGNGTGYVLPGNGSALTFNNITATGNYSILAANAATGCNLIMNGFPTVTMNPVPTISSITGNTSICSGSSTSLLATSNDGGSYYKWYTQASGGTPISSSANLNTGSLTADATYYVEVANGFGCTSARTSVTVTVKARPANLSFTVANNCDGTSTITANNLTGSILWSTGQTINPISVTTAGVYTATQSANGCTSSVTGASANPKTAPSAAITADGPASVCPGGVVVLHANTGSGYGYEWMKDGVDIPGSNAPDYTATVSGNYSVIIHSNGCSSVASNTIGVAIEDVTAPATPALSDITAECSATVTAPTTTDNCSGTITGTTSDPLTYTAQGDYTIHWTFTDNANNSTTATQQVHVHDVTPPTVNCPGDITVNADVVENGSGGAHVSYSATGTDNCGTASISYSIAPGSFFPIGTTQVTVTADDGHGNTSTCTFNVTVNCVAPVFTTCGTDQTVSNDPGQCGAVVNYTTAASGIPAASLSYSFSGATTGSGSGDGSGSFFNTGQTIVNIIASNVCGTATCSFTITVKDTEKPMITAPADITVNNDPGKCSAVISAAGISQTSNTHLVAYWNFDEGNGTTVSDQSGNSLNGTFVGSLNWVNSTAFTGAGNALQYNGAGFVTVPDNPAINTLQPNMTIEAWVYQTDNANNTIIDRANYNFLFEIKPNGQPGLGFYNPTDGWSYSTASIPVNQWVHVACTWNSSTHELKFYKNGVQTDNIYRPSALYFNSGEINIGRQSPQTCACNIMNGTIDELKLWSGVRTANEIQASATNTPISTHTLGNAVTTDNCGVAGVTNDAPGTFPVGTTNVIWTVTDIHGNAQTAIQNVTVVDNEKPKFTCPGDITVNANATDGNGNAGYYATYAISDATDNCGVQSTVFSIPSGSFFGLGTTPVTVTVTDIHGNTSTCTFNVTVNCVAPVFTTCGTDQTVSNDQGQCGAVVNYTTAASGIPAASLSYSFSGATTGSGSGDGSGSFFNTGTTLVTITASSTCGSSTCTFNITVNDTEAPVPPSIQNITEECLGRVSLHIKAPVASDNCSGNVIGTTTDAVDFVSGTQGDFLIHWTFTDDAGNTSTAIQQVHIHDDIAPIVNCPGDITVTADVVENGQGGSHVTYSASATDNCTSKPSISYSIDPGSFFPIGTTPVTVTADDGHGNTSTCTFNVTVNCVAPVFTTCGTDQTVSNDPGQCGAVVNYTTAASGIPAASLSYSFSGATTGSGSGDGGGSFFNKGTTTVTVTATNLCGTATCTFKITVADNENPVITGLPTNISVGNDVGVCGAKVNWAAPSVSDNCPGATLVSDHQSGDLFPLGTTTVTYTATDAVGHTVTGSFTVTVTDNEKPAVVCPGDITVTADVVENGTGGSHVTYNASGTDNCGTPSISYSIAPGSFFPIGTTPVTVTADDGHGNTSTCTFNVTVNCVAPVFTTCGTDQTVSNDPGQCSAVVNYTTAASGIPAASMSYSFSGATTGSGSGDGSGSFFNKGTTTVTITATNLCGTATCTFKITVADNENPVITGLPVNISVGNDAGVCGAKVNWTAPTVSDNCPGATLVSDHQSGDLFPLGTTTVTYTATDAVGHTVTGSFTVTVTDNEKPVITCPGDYQLACGLSADPSRTGKATATDNCGTPVITYSDVVNGNTTTRTWKATDAAGNFSTCVQTITQAGPFTTTVASVPTSNVYTGGVPTSLYLGYGAQSTTLQTNVPAGDTYSYAWTGSGVAGLSNTNTANPVFSPTQAGSYNFTVTAINQNGCASTGYITICVTDIRVPAGMHTGDGGYDHNGSGGDDHGSGDDNHHVDCNHQAHSAQDCPHKGDSIKCDHKAHPADKCPYKEEDQKHHEDGKGSYSHSGGTGEGGHYTSGGDSHKGDGSKENDDKDGHSGHVTCDHQAHSAKDCPHKGDKIPCDHKAHSADKCPYKDEENKDDHGSGDGQHGQDNYKVFICHVPPGNPSNPLTLSISINAVAAHLANHPGDRLGSCDQAPCSGYTDHVNPVVNCPAAVIVDCAGSTSPTSTGKATGTDNSGTVTISYHDASTQSADVTDAAHYNYTITRTWRATDPSGNYSECSQVITVKDITNPVVNCPGDITVSCSGASTGTATATDNSGGPIAITYTDQPNKYGFYRTWKATDASGNSATCTQKVTVQDNIAPVVTCPGDKVVGCGGSTDPVATGYATATDNCGSPVVTYSDVTGDNGVIKRTWKATDAAGNYSTCVQTITKPTGNPCALPYPYVEQGNPRTSVTFNEGEVLRAIEPNASLACGTTPTQIKVWYNDEHALTLGVRQVVVKTKSGTTTTNYPVSVFGGTASSVSNPQLGTTADGSSDQSGNDVADGGGRPLRPVLYISDITNDPNNRVGDWQHNGTAYAPDKVSGSWKSAVRTVDKTKYPAVVTITPDADPRTRNNWYMGAGGDVAPAGLDNEGYGAEIVWNIGSLPLLPGHTYRIQVIVHDGDQNKCGGDAGQACAVISIPSNAVITSTVSKVATATTENAVAPVTETPLNVTVMPNPSTTYFTLKITSKSQAPVNMRVMDASGRVVESKSKLNPNGTVQVGFNYASGIYYAELEQEGKRKVVQLIKGRG